MFGRRVWDLPVIIASVNNTWITLTKPAWTALFRVEIRTEEVVPAELVPETKQRTAGREHPNYRPLTVHQAASLSQLLASFTDFKMAAFASSPEL